MFTKYWRTYPAKIQVFLFIVMLFVIGIFGYLLAFNIGRLITGVTTYNEINSNTGTRSIQAARIIELIGNLLTFCGTALIFAYLTHPKPLTYLGFRKPSKISNIIISMILMVTLIPLAQQLLYYLKMIDLGSTVKMTQTKTEEAYKAILNMHSVSELIMCLLMTSVVAPIGEELLFRGIIMRFGYKATHRILASALISGIFFAFFHAQIYAFLPIMLSGMVLSYIYYYNGTIWANIISHCTYNTIQVMIVYLTLNKLAPGMSNLNDIDHYPIYVVIIAAFFFILCFYLLWKNRTPLPNNWANDFTLEELAAEKQVNS